MPVGTERFVAGGFALTDFAGDGQYQLVSEIDSLEPGAHHVVFDGGQCFYWIGEYGPGFATVGGGLIEASLTLQDEGSRVLRATFRIPMA